MKKKHKSLAGFVDYLQRNARYTFTRVEAQETLELRNDALTKALQRLTHIRRISQIQRGFYTIVPLEYASSGTPPVDWFIDDLMSYIGCSQYYVGVLTAALMHGAGHQRPQEYQVVIQGSRRIMHGNGFRIRFFRYAEVDKVIVEERQTYTGYIPVSRPESTALDLVRFSKTIGGLGSALTVLSELGENIDSNILLDVSKKERMLAIVQRTGWLLDRAGWKKQTSVLAEWLQAQSPGRIALNPGIKSKRGTVCRKWMIIVNDDSEGDL